ncbi:MAG: ATP-binding protein [Acidimicrobiaceae bacterium]|nr:ATP-binding protein [Acidimicrobiaceae bacterium]
MMEQPSQGRFDLVPTNLAVTAMRDNGYKNTAYALAELIDNSIQAGASRVEVLCSEHEEQLTRRRRRIDEIAVVDNGCGMDLTTLRMALQFGNGTRLDDRSGMGRFGMGLPNSSISQCRRVDVWTWQEGVDSALHTSIDLDDIERGGGDQVPLPAARPIPPLWRSAVTFASEPSGTLIVWSKLDKCAWKTAKAIIDNSEFLVGRMYRRFIDQGRATIRMAAFLKNRPNVFSIDKAVQVNDPLYLMSPSSTPKPFAKEAMFEPYGESWEYPHNFIIDGKEYEAVARFTVARQDARSNVGARDAGHSSHGRHARRNVGVSIVRADREIELSLALVNPHDTRERWWGVEIDFPPELDELFGVTNNKQSARTLSDLLDREVESMLEPGQTPQQFFDELLEAGDGQLELIRFTEQIRKVLAALRQQIRSQAKPRRERHKDRDSAEHRGTAGTRVLQKKGYSGGSDEAESLPPEIRLHELQQSLQEAGIPQDIARREASETVHSGIKYQFIEATLDSPAFFSVQPRGGVILIALNTKHPVHEHLIEVLDPNESEGNGSLQNAREGLRLLLEAWARYEDEQPEGPMRDSCMDARNDWGRVARHFFSV